MVGEASNLEVLKGCVNYVGVLEVDARTRASTHTEVEADLKKGLVIPTRPAENAHIHLCVQASFPDGTSPEEIEGRRTKLAQFIAAEVSKAKAALNESGNKVEPYGEALNATHNFEFVNSRYESGSSPDFKTYAYEVKLPGSIGDFESTSPQAELLGFVIGRLIMEGFLTPEVLAQSEKLTRAKLSKLPNVQRALDTVQSSGQKPGSVLSELLFGSAAAKSAQRSAGA